MPQRILITGTSSGFGAAAAIALAARGHHVFASMRQVNGKNESAAAALRAASPTIEIVELDVTDDASTEAAVATVLAKAGGIDVLINNVGQGTWGLAESYTAAQVEALFATNVISMVRVNNAVLPQLRAAGAGYVVYVSSGLGRIVLPFIGPYTATKFAVEALAEAWSYELAPLGIETTILQPGAYGTGFMQNSLQGARPELLGSYGPSARAFEAMSKGFAERHAAGQMGNPDEIRDAIVELVELPRGQKPLRRTVGADVAEPVSAINKTCEVVQDGLLRAFGLRNG